MEKRLYSVNAINGCSTPISNAGLFEIANYLANSTVSNKSILYAIGTSVIALGCVSLLFVLIGFGL